MRSRRALALVAFAASAAIAVAGVLEPLGGHESGRQPPARSAASPSPARSRRRRPPLPRRGPVVREVPILMYHVIDPPFPDSPFPGLYVPATEFAAQMQALARAGYHGVTLDEVERNWTAHIALPARKPIVITFDNGYRSQFTNALPVLRRLGWPAVENIQLSGLPPSQGGLTAREVRALVRAGWELDTQGFSHLDLPTLAPAQLRHEVLGARLAIEHRYDVPVDWFCYPSGRYDATVVAEVQAAGYVGATTVVPGWADETSDSYRLPRLRVLGGTSPRALLDLIAGTRDAPPPPLAY